MKLFQFLGGVAMCAASSLFLLSCNKNENLPSPTSEIENNQRLSGVAEDDPAVIARIPKIVSADFLSKSSDIGSDVMFARGKPDNTPPTVSISSPSNSNTVSGTVNVQAVANDNIGVSLVSLSINGTLIGSDNSSPYLVPWNSATLPNGTHTMMVTARDAAGNTRSVSIQVIGNNTAGGDVTNPTVSLTSPSNSASVSGSINIMANANDNIAVSNVKFSVDGTLISTDNAAPYNSSWNANSVSSGIHTLTATAIDAAGNSNAHSIQITVNTVVLPPPPSPLPTSFQMIMPPVTNQGGESACAVFSSVYAARSAEHFYSTGASLYSYSTNIFSPEFVYNQTKISDCGSGTGVVTALDFMKNTGVCTWQTMPYSSSNGCDILPNSAQLNEAANYKIASYAGVPGSDITAIKTMLVNKHALIVTVGTDDSFWNAQPGFIWKNFSGPMGISHALVICGYDDAKHAYKVMNSWGTSWGDGGYAWIDYDFLPQCSAYYLYVING